jgi:hypothetical protein
MFCVSVALPASQLEAALVARLGVRISRTALDKLLKREPVAIRPETMQLLCSLLQLPLQTFLSVTPEPAIPHPGGVTQPYVRQEKRIDIRENSFEIGSTNLYSCLF